jgi:hypothetical protein
VSWEKARNERAQPAKNQVEKSPSLAQSLSRKRLFRAIFFLLQRLFSANSFVLTAP